MGHEVTVGPGFLHQSPYFILVLVCLQSRSLPVLMCWMQALSFVHCCVGCTHIAVDDMRKHHTDAGFLGCSSTKGVCGCHVLRAGRLLPTKVFDVVGVPTLSVVYSE